MYIYVCTRRLLAEGSHPYSAYTIPCEAATAFHTKISIWHKNIKFSRRNFKSSTTKRKNANLKKLCIKIYGCN